MRTPVRRRAGDTSLLLPWISDQLVRADLFSIERLEQHAESLAEAQPVAEYTGGESPLAKRVRDNYRFLRGANRQLTRATSDGQPITPAAQWLTDNFHVLQTQIKEIDVDLPPGYYRLLPKLSSGPFEGYPRVFGLSWAFVAHTDSHFEARTLARFVNAYQRVQPLTIGELWAVAIALRIVLVENLRRAAKIILDNRAQRERANQVADSILATEAPVATVTPEVLERIPNGPLEPTFAVQLVKRLRDQAPSVTPALLWLEERLAAQGTTADEIVRAVHQNQAAMSVTVRNIITSMRMISNVDWAELFESVSLVDARLREASDFALLDFATRDNYRAAIEELARGSVLSELEVTREALRMAAARGGEAAVRGDPLTMDRYADPGFHLIGGGRGAFEQAIGFTPPAKSWLRRLWINGGIQGYLSVLAVFTLVILILGSWQLEERGMGPKGLLLLAFLGLFPAAEAAIALANRLFTGILKPMTLPALALREGVPDALRTMVVVPTLLTSPAAIAEQIENLEIHHLASPDGAVFFALLTDWTDADAETAPDDADLLRQAGEGIARLNNIYGPVTGAEGDFPRFLLLHRRRAWNAGEGRWIGWERKRGKLHELNRLLRGATDTSYIDLGEQTASPEVPPNVRYVVTLDSDTRLPREALRRLIGKMAHPLNRPRFDPVSKRVVEGYGILQPRVTPSLPLGAEVSVFQHAFSSTGGIDPYAGAVSDVYQDLFGEGSYAGKGIYDVDVFERALEGRVPDNTMLSHDLFEGVFARAGLASDIEVVEEFPARYDVAVARQHRWARGDWQLLPWILGRAGGRPGAGIPINGRWKMLDNLRRGLTPVMTVLALLGGLLLPTEKALTWTAFVLLILAVPPLLPLLGALSPRRDVTLASHARVLFDDLKLAGTQIGLAIVLLADQAALMVDAIARTLARVFVTRRHLLEWTTSDQAKARGRRDLTGYYHSMVGGVAVSALALVVMAVGRGAWMVGFPLAMLWLAAPAVAWWASLSPHSGDSEAATDQDGRTLRLIARRTWRFFETFVTEGENHLPPDNFQEDPKPVVAHRTSPTNIGLYLLSVASARDFGWIGLTEAVERLEATMATLDRMERMRGHLYNWYDTTNLRPLDPKYISSVDSGNLAGHLITLANACREWSAAPLDGARVVGGVGDALELAREHLAATRNAAGTTILRGDSTVSGRFESALDALAAILGRDPAPLSLLPEIETRAGTVVSAATALIGADPSAAGILVWAEAIQHSAASHARDLAALVPGRLADSAEAKGKSLAALEDWLAAAGACTSKHRGAARDLEQRLSALAGHARNMADAMRFDFLLDPDRNLLSIGYRPGDSRLDESSYDLLASEARLASFLAIAKGDAPVSHWFRLGRATTGVGRGAALISWSGSMFEYLMPALVMRAPTGSLLASTNRLVVRRQIAYGAQVCEAWGMSESAYNVRDLELTYQYGNFGVPDLALKRGLGENVVLAPYATALAAMVDPGAAVRNFAKLESSGGLGVHGFYEAMDYTPARVPEGQKVAVVHAYMAHHQGMSIVAIANILLDGIMRTRFHAEPSVQATELLLQERAPRQVTIRRLAADDPRRLPGVGEYDHTIARRLTSPHGMVPATHVLSNGRYSVMVTSAGAGYSRWQGRAITRWREDLTCDDWGSWLYLRDVESDEVWSAGHQPSGREADYWNIILAEERAEFLRRDGTLVTNTEIIVSAEDDAEVRRVSVTNNGTRTREIELTSYMELVLATPADDGAHPAFSKMFVQTEFLPERGLLLATRRKRAPAETGIWAAHLMVVEGETIGDLHVETDRAAFLERGRTARDPAAMSGGRPLSGTVGTVLDPAFSLRRRVRIAPGTTARLAFWTIVAETREDILVLADRHHDTSAFERAETLAWTQARVQLHHLGIGSADANNFQRLAGHVLYINALLRPPSDVLARGGAGPAGLWAHGISGDLPIVLVRIDDADDLDFIREMIQAHEYWRMKQLAVDVVILNEKASSYNQDLQIAVDAAVRTGQTRLALAGGFAQGNVFVLRTDLIKPETQALLLSIARVVLLSRRGNLASQLDRLEDQRLGAPPARPPVPPRAAVERERPAPELEFFNGWGGFAEDGREYVTLLRPGVTTPAPWTNIVANPTFGFQVTAEGGGYSWWRNSRENQLTPWSNDPVGDRSGDVLYLRDEETGALWSPMARPVPRASGSIEARHGMGYSRFLSTAQGVEMDLLQFVPLEESVKISRLRVRNASGRVRRLSLTSYVEWVLGPSRTAALANVVTEHDAPRGAVLARNPWNTSFGSYVAFSALPGRAVRATGDRREFLGRNGTLAAPAGLARGERPSGRFGAGLDPCAALQTEFALQPNETLDLVILLGAAPEAGDATRLIDRYGTADLDAELAAVRAHWDTVTGGIQVRTPDRPLDLMLNHWLLYQTLVCRVWARAGFYQASGAFGFRDQLQDGMALAGTRPDLTRAHLLRAASRQFVEGDMQHWWLPSGGQGVRTRISDDRVWLAYVVLHYVTATGDKAVLDEQVPFLVGPPLGEHEHDAYYHPEISPDTATLFEHCARGLDIALATGAHGLPLIGTGDWNDGMSRVGEAGRGESTWLAWFLYETLMTFAPVAEGRGDYNRASTWRNHATTMRASIEDQAWDGAWYRRGYFDDGSPLGSASSGECRIDAIAQSWAVISGGAEPGRAQRAMAAMEEQLIRRHDGMALLFTPPFDRTPLDPGYIKGYPPGLRENGGQYTHAAIWSVIAFAMMGDGDKATGLFSMLNPINHALTSADAYRYKVEPYVIAADIYSAPGHVGRGGWTWYTGSAGWMYRAGIEYILGLRREGGTLLIDPRVPRTWPGFEATVRHGGATYEIVVENPNRSGQGIAQASVDGMAVAARPLRFAMVDDGATHAVRVVLG